jgi:hypothetical protein
MRILLGSVGTGIRKRDVAGFPAIRAIIEAVRGQPDVVLPFADGAIFFAGAVFFRLFAHGADDGTGHWETSKENCT